MADPHGFQIPPAEELGHSDQTTPRQRGGTILVVIGILKLIKGVTTLLLGLMALHLIHQNMAIYVERWAQYLHADPNGRWTTWLLAHAFVLSPKKLLELGIGLFVYAGLFLTEGIGLMFRKHWAEYFTTVCTGLFIPLELYEIWRRIIEHRHVMAAFFITGINIAIVAYLVVRLRWESRQLHTKQSI